MTFQEIRIIATGPCITNQLRDVSTICRRSWNSVNIEIIPKRADCQYVTVSTFKKSPVRNIFIHFSTLHFYWNGCDFFFLLSDRIIIFSEFHASLYVVIAMPIRDYCSLFLPPSPTPSDRSIVVNKLYYRILSFVCIFEEAGSNRFQT